jgi:hypothetical protein
MNALTEHMKKLSGKDITIGVLSVALIAVSGIAICLGVHDEMDGREGGEYYGDRNMRMHGREEKRGNEQRNNAAVRSNDVKNDAEDPTQADGETKDDAAQQVDMRTPAAVPPPGGGFIPSK